MSELSHTLNLPRKIHSRRQYVLWTWLAVDTLVKVHGYRGSDFIRIGKTDPSMNYCNFYPWHWQRKWSLGGQSRGWSGWIEKFPRNAAIYWPDGVTICGDGYDPRCPIMMLAEHQAWADIKIPEDY
ncbi:hypothetical protein G6K96_21795 [Agrobacterium vitis]|uniref:hypothetical protein n=1 Tax=Agrobacterium vitis TaxID=373 RepID=UPI0015718B3F|nr:hypothetical protein [Agrobacterium vitis]NTA34369.1 hypothetical protein [Agrobacterium vitis]